MFSIRKVQKKKQIENKNENKNFRGKQTLSKMVTIMTGNFT